MLLRCRLQEGILLSVRFSVLKVPFWQCLNKWTNLFCVLKEALFFLNSGNSISSSKLRIQTVYQTICLNFDAVNPLRGNMWSVVAIGWGVQVSDYFFLFHLQQRWQQHEEGELEHCVWTPAGAPIRPEQQNIFFTLLLAVYLIAVLWNLLLILLIRLDSCLHTLMYFFLIILHTMLNSHLQPPMYFFLSLLSLQLPSQGCPGALRVST